MTELEKYAEKFYEWILIKNYSKRTVEIRRDSLRVFFDWCYERGLESPKQISRSIVDRYQVYIFHYKKTDGKPLKTRSQHIRLISVKMYFMFLSKKRYIEYNPAADLEMPRIEKRLPKHILTANEAEKIMDSIDVTSEMGIRDRAILETFYSTGIRRGEMSYLKIYDIDFDRGFMMIRQGKGAKDRLIPIGKRALFWIQKYLYEIRHKYSVYPDESYMFLTKYGTRIARKYMSIIVKNAVRAANIDKDGACHMIRHTVATLMHESGADILHIQQLLGHERISTTQIYTKLNIKKLKEVHEQLHPAEIENRNNTAKNEQFFSEDI